MSTQAEIDLEARIGDLERQLAELAAKVNPLYAGGMDRYIHSGYMQFDGIPIRWDTKGMQVESDGVLRASVYFVKALVQAPGSETERAELIGSVDAPSVLTGLQAIHSGGLGGVFMGAASGTANAELTIFVSGWSNQPRAKLYPLTTDIGKLELQDAVLSFAGLASDPGTLTDGLIWYNTTTDKLYARINGATVELGGGGGMSLIVKEANETVNNSNALQNDDELLFAVAANEVWQFEGVLFVSSNTTPDFKLTFTGPTGAVGGWGAIINTNSASATAQNAAGAVLGSADNLTTSGTFIETIRFWGGIHNGANAGNLTLQWAQNTANASNTIVYAGSYIKYQKET